MKRCVLAVLALAVFAAAIPVAAQNLNTVVAGTEIHLSLQNKLTTAFAHAGDPFVAVVTDPVYVDSLLVIPAGTRITGIVGAVVEPRHFALFRGEAAMNLNFRNIQISGRDVPVQMSILDIIKRSSNGTGRYRHDVKLEEGSVIEQKHDIKGDVIAGTIGTGGATLIGTLARHAAGGFGIGLAGSAIYVIQRKGKDVVLPAETGMVVRLDNKLLLPTVNSTVANSTSPAPVAPAGQNN
ncbi:MAG TPA: hypothetical protein VFO34_02385 [Candidatus Acidoferrales bacterium]|nr:hypothetical protein [Candidatus Acidoferrales bacterium]